MIPTTEGINQVIRNNKDKIEVGKISDGYHTFDELYDHRCVLFLDLCLYLNLISKDILNYREEPVNKHLNRNIKKHKIWRSKAHSDGSVWDGWFIMGIDKEQGEQITYHLPMKYWNNSMWAETLDKAPEFDGHRSTDVLERLKSL